MSCYRSKPHIHLVSRSTCILVIAQDISGIQDNLILGSAKKHTKYRTKKFLKTMLKKLNKGATESEDRI